jgi:hypothetical protein
MKEKLFLGVLAGMLFALTACAGSQAEHGDGVIIMTPYVSEEYGIRGAWPDGMPQESFFQQESVPLPLDEFYPLALARTDLVELPEPVGSYRGTAFTWDLYTFETRLADLGAETVRVDLAVSGNDSITYFVALVTQPDDYIANAPLYETAFTHALYALAPLE